MRLKFINYILILLILSILAASCISAADDDYKMSTVSFDNFSIDLPYGSYFNETEPPEDANFTEYIRLYENHAMYEDEIDCVAFFAYNGSLDQLNGTSNDSDGLVVISKENNNSVLFEAPEKAGFKYLLCVMDDSHKSVVEIGGNNLNLMRNASASIKFNNETK